MYGKSSEHQFDVWQKLRTPIWHMTKVQNTNLKYDKSLEHQSWRMTKAQNTNMTYGKSLWKNAIAPLGSMTKFQSTNLILGKMSFGQLSWGPNLLVPFCKLKIKRKRERGRKIERESDVICSIKVRRHVVVVDVANSIKTRMTKIEHFLFEKLRRRKKR